VIGAGIIGACIAHELIARGHRVLLIERDAPGRACSFGNAGAISEWSIVPLAMPGVLRSAPAMLLDPESPLRIVPSYLPRALPWLARFVATARTDVVERNAARLAALNADAGTLHARLGERVGAPELVVRAGHLYLYPDAAALAQDAAGWKLRREHGCRPVELDREGIIELEPRVSERYRMGMWLPDQAFVAQPLRYVERIVRSFTARGGTLVHDAIRRLTRRGAAWMLEGDGGTYDAVHAIVAAGAWSARLLRSVGVRVPLESQRGYHAAFHGVRAPISRVVVLADRKAFMTPMEEGMRIAGTVELGGLERPPDMRRARVLERFAREAVSGLDAAQVSHWMGHRPCLPDSVPRIGPVDERAGLWMAIGHGHLGVTQAPITAQRIATAIDENVALYSTTQALYAE
jgi:D-amino-acid dehydrogenase